MHPADQRRVPPEGLKALGLLLGHSFADPALLQQALTHSSAKSRELPSNERLEFFGDAVLGFVITEMIYTEYPDHPEGEMTRVKSVLVSREMLADKAKLLRLQDIALLGKGVGDAGSLPRSILANLFEAIIAALYLDGGLEVARRFIVSTFADEIEPLIGSQLTRNYKSAFQQLVQAQFGTTPVYTVVSASGPDHNKQFVVSACIDQRSFPPAFGASKKEAEQAAARLALKELLGEMDLGDDESAMVLELEMERDLEGEV